MPYIKSFTHNRPLINAERHSGACDPSEVTMEECPDVILKKTNWQQVSSPCVEQEVTDREEL